MKITDVQTIRIDKIRHGVLGYLVLVKTDVGLVGLGEVAADCHPATVAFAIRQMRLEGYDPLAIEGFWQQFYQAQLPATYPLHSEIYARIVSLLQRNQPASARVLI